MVASVSAFLMLFLTVLSPVLLDLHTVVQVVDIPLLLVQNVQSTVSTHTLRL